MPITAEGIAELVRLGWLSRRHSHEPMAVSEAVVALANAALDTYLRPADGDVSSNRSTWNRQMATASGQQPRKGPQA